MAVVAIVPVAGRVEANNRAAVVAIVPAVDTLVPEAVAIVPVAAVLADSPDLAELDPYPTRNRRVVAHH